MAPVHQEIVTLVRAAHPLGISLPMLFATGASRAVVIRFGDGGAVTFNAPLHAKSKSDSKVEEHNDESREYT
jgi:hypothetical protein